MRFEDVEAIRRHMMALLADCTALRRAAARAKRAPRRAQPDVACDIEEIADRIDRITRELYHLLPEHLRPPEPQNLEAPRSKTGSSAGRPYQPPRPGGPIPRKVRWPDWTTEEVLALADAHNQEKGHYPTRTSGRISDDRPDTWNGIDLALKKGNRGLPGGSSLAKLLQEHRGVHIRRDRPALHVEEILERADEHQAVNGVRPRHSSGPVIGMPGETWSAINHALIKGTRGLPGGSSLALLLAEHRGAPYPPGLPDLTEKAILEWADDHRGQNGLYPTSRSGTVLAAPAERWSRIDTALIAGHRSLPGGSSLAKLLAEHRGVRNRKALPPFDSDSICLWAVHHREATGRRPTVWSGPILDAPGETWAAVDAALKAGGRGLAGCGYASLAHLLDERLGRREGPGGRRAARGG